MNAVHRFSSGTPRIINTLCDNALFEGYVARVPMIDEAMIARVAAELGLSSSAERAAEAPAPLRAPPPVHKEPKPLDLGEIDRYLAGLAKPS